ncbi:hypothetical protein EsH8_II_000340 [Colletotrichum jinshuiense]
MSGSTTMADDFVPEDGTSTDEMVTEYTSSADKAIFTIGGKLNIADSSPKEPATSSIEAGAIKPLVIRWDTGNQNHGRRLTLPVQDDKVSQVGFGQLLQDCQPATFGRHDQEVFDETYRKAAKLNDGSFCTNFNPYEHGIINTVVQALAHDDNSSDTNRGIRAELYSLNVSL